MYEAILKFSFEGKSRRRLKYSLVLKTTILGQQMWGNIFLKKS